MTETPRCVPGARLCKPYRAPRPSGKFDWRHGWDCLDKPGELMHYARENVQGRTLPPRGWRGVR